VYRLFFFLLFEAVKNCFLNKFRDYDPIEMKFLEQVRPKVYSKCIKTHSARSCGSKC